MQGQSPHAETVEGTILLVCGIILIIPGFITDVLVLPLLIPALRRRVAARMLARLAAQRRGGVQYDSQVDDDFVQTRSSSYTAYTNSGSPFVFYRFFISSSDVRNVDTSKYNCQTEINDHQEVIDCTIDCTAELEDQNPDENNPQNSNKDSGQNK